MEFTLTAELTEQIIFAMEDQQNTYWIHKASGELVREDQLEQGGETGESYLPIPDWQPADGFQLMERFVARLRNPLLRDGLQEALASGRGVFRKFKDILKGSAEVQRLWFRFKERELRRVVREWYNDSRELAGLERLEEVAEETEGIEELLETDFAIVELEERHLASVMELDRAAFLLRFPEAETEQAAELYRDLRESLPAANGEGSLVFVSETPELEFAGFVWAVEEGDPLLCGRILRVAQLAVVERFRGLGLGAMLLRRMIAEARDRGYHRLRSELNGSGLELSGFFENLGFRTIAKTVDLDPTYWEE